MPKLIAAPTRITAAGNKPKLIDEYVGHVNSAESRLSIAHMRSPGGWVEPGQTPEFDEFTVVLKGTLRVAHKAGTLDVAAGQAVVAHAGEWIQYGTPGVDGAEYIAVCLPAFSPETVHRDAFVTKGFKEKVAEAVEALAAIPGIDRKQAHTLVHAGWIRLEDLLQANESDLAGLPQIGDQAAVILEAARAASAKRKFKVGETNIAFAVPFADEWIAAWNSHDLDRILQHYASDVELISPFVPQILGTQSSSVRGITMLRDYFSRAFNAYPDLRFVLHDVFTGTQSIVIQYESVAGQLAAEMMEFNEIGKIRLVVAHYSAKTKSI